MRTCRWLTRRAVSVARPLFIGILCLAAYGCVSIEGDQPRVSRGFVPKKVYDVGYDRMWDKVVGLMKQDGVILQAANKENGLIVTDFIGGPTVDVAAVSTRHFRYKYQLALEKVGAAQTRVDIKCKLEEMKILKGRIDQVTPWRDVTHSSKDIASQFELALYERIEKGL